MKIVGFGDHVIAELQRLGDGDHIAVQGSLKVETYEKNGETCDGDGHDHLDDEMPF